MLTHTARANPHDAPHGLAGGAFIFLAFIVLYLIAVTFSLYTKTGSGISQRPYRSGASDLVHDRVAARHITRGTRA